MHDDRLAWHKLRRNQPVTAADLGQLQTMLKEAGGADGDIARARNEHLSLAAFIGSLAGLDRKAARQAVGHLLAGATATASPIEVIEQAINHLAPHGAMPAARLYESPFTDLHAPRPDGVCTPVEVQQLFAALNER